MFRTVFLFVISLLHLCADAYPVGFPSAAPISPYIGSIPALVNAHGHNQILQQIMRSPSTSYSNGFFWPPPPALVEKILQRYILQSSGLSGLNSGSLRLGGLGLGLNNINSIGLLGNPLNLGFTRGAHVSRIPSSFFPSTL